MAIGVGDSIPDVTLAVMGDSGPEQVTTDDLFKGKKKEENQTTVLNPTKQQ